MFDCDLFLFDDMILITRVELMGGGIQSKTSAKKYEEMKGRGKGVRKGKEKKEGKGKGKGR